MRILFIGDVVGRPGRTAVKALIPAIKTETGAEVVIANGENLAAGIGVTPEKAREMLEGGVDILTGGNHVWKKKEIGDFLNNTDRMIRPANYPPGAPGLGATVMDLGGRRRLGVLNLQGRIFMNDPLDCPFRCADREVAALREHTPVIIVDFHAETTSEKRALAIHLDGKVTALVGTHTHVQTADEMILPDGTGFISDVGMAGPIDSVIGMKKEQVLHRFKTQLPVMFQVAGGEVCVDAVLIEADERTGRCLSIWRMRRRFN
ncbi:MAG: TIGR00282 family metallophosphoesterase [Deltaproteobacteria bacterium]|nr:TIGR00282 family metallophosphoesterase [Deltaproteobacteria bacterium]